MIPAISAALGALDPSEWSVGSVGGLGSADALTTSGAGSAGGGFSSALSSAIDSLQQSQSGAESAAQALATGQASDPTQAITTVENASLAMDLAAQIRTKLTDATNTIFQTQV